MNSFCCIVDHKLRFRLQQGTESSKINSKIYLQILISTPIFSHIFFLALFFFQISILNTSFEKTCKGNGQSKQNRYL